MTCVTALNISYCYHSPSQHTKTNHPFFAIIPADILGFVDRTKEYLKRIFKIQRPFRESAVAFIRIIRYFHRNAYLLYMQKIIETSKTLYMFMEK